MKEPEGPLLLIVLSPTVTDTWLTVGVDIGCTQTIRFVDGRREKSVRTNFKSTPKTGRHKKQKRTSNFFIEKVQQKAGKNSQRLAMRHALRTDCKDMDHQNPRCHEDRACLPT